MTMKSLKTHLILGKYFYTDQYKWDEDGKFFADDGNFSKLVILGIVTMSAGLLWIVVPNKLDKTTYVAFNEILFTYFCFMCLLLSSYFSQKSHVETYNGLEEIDDALAKMNLCLTYQSSIITNHVTIFISYIFLVISGFVNMYCAKYCDARNSTVFKFVLMSELIYKTSILSAVIRIMRDRYRGLNDILRTVGKRNKTCLLCHRTQKSREELWRVIGSYHLEEYCLLHILKFVRIIHHKLTECATSWNFAMNPYIIIILMTASVELYTQILFLFTIFTQEKALTKAGEDTLALSLFTDFCIFSSMFNLLYCCQNLIEEWNQTARIVHRLFYTNKKNNAAVSEIMSFSYQLKQKPFRFVYIGRTPLNWGTLVIMLQNVVQLAVIGLQFKFNEYFKI